MIGHRQVWWADLAGHKIRPVVILTRESVAPLVNRVLVAPLTSTIRDLPTEVFLDMADGVLKPCVANFDNAQLITVDRLLGQIGEIDESRWPEVCRAMAAVLDC